MRAFGLPMVFAALVGAAPAAAQSVALTAAAGHRIDLSAEAVAAFLRATVSFAAHGDPCP